MIALAQTGEVEKTKRTRETNVSCMPYIWSTNVAQIWRTIDQSDQWTQVDVAFVNLQFDSDDAFSSIRARDPDLYEL
jgi:hypothetical protein